MMAGAAIIASVRTSLTTIHQCRSSPKGVATDARVGQRAELIQGAPDLIAFGAARRRLSLLADLDRELANTQACSARTSGLGAGLTVLTAGLAGWAVLALGVSAVHSGALSGVALAVVALIPVAAFEAVTILPPAVQHLQRGRRSAARVTDVPDRAAPVQEPAAPSALPPGHYTVRVEGLRAPVAQGQRSCPQRSRLRTRTWPESGRCGPERVR
jgi:ABC-type transport system involved in cytochrome bd biosynthesis fused ATPase/permease subunit